MQKTVFILVVVLIFISSCSPRIVTSIQKKYEPINRNLEIKVLESLKDVPQKAELLGKVDIGDSGFTSNCSYDTVKNAAMQEARKAGGNMICITNHLFPDFRSTCHRITANIYKIDPLSDISISTSSIQKPDSSAIQNNVAINDSIEIIKKGIGYQYKYNGEILSLNQMGIFLEKNKISEEIYKTTKGTSGLLNVLGFAGGFCIGYGLAPLLYGREPNLTLTGIGCGVLLVSIPIVSSAERKLKKAVLIYNSNPQQVIIHSFQYEMKFAIVQNGVGVILKF